MIFTIDGNIGSGKSTLLDYLHNTLHLSTDPEPVSKWQPFLEDIYKNKSRLFSNYALNPIDFYHDKLITIKKLDPKDGPHFIESMLQNMTHGSDETLKKYISGEIKFSNEPFK